MLDHVFARRLGSLLAPVLWLSLSASLPFAAFGQTADAPPKPMAADADPAFEVAVIKPANPDARGSGFRLQEHSFAATNLTVADLMVFSFAVNARQVAGGPDWLTKEKFDITAKPDTEGLATREQYGIMIRKLLADRFKLTLHHESRELAAYLLEIGKNGSKLKKHSPEDAGLGNLNMTFRNGGMLLNARNESMAAFTLGLQQAVLDQPVLDRTNLLGRFDFQFAFSPEGTKFGSMRLPASTDEPAPSLFTAIQDLGLKLDAVKTPIDVLVIDTVEHPSEN